MFICEGNSTVSLTETHLRRLVFTRALGRGAGSPKASPRSLTPGFSDQPLASLAAEGAQTLALWEQHSFSTFFFLPCEHPRSPGEPRAGGGPRQGTVIGHRALRDRPRLPTVPYPCWNVIMARSRAPSVPRARFLGAVPGNGAVAPRRPAGTPRKLRGIALSGSCWRKGKAGRL